VALMGRQSFRGLFAFGLSLPPPLAECGLNPLQNNIVDFAALLVGRLPQGLIQALGEIDRRMDDSGPGRSPWGPR